jgi:RNA polymerase sigma factor for flagellar operon FliA
VEELEFSELRERLNGCLMRLPPQQRQVVELFYHQGLNQKTIAEKLKLSRPKVCRLIDRAVRFLQKELKK